MKYFMRQRRREAHKSQRCHTFMSNFGEVINQCYLMDLGFQGQNFTWNNKQKESGYIQECLDRFLANFSWKSMFQEAQVTHLDYFGSDHRIIKEELNPVSSALSFQNSCSYAFRFEPFWRTNENFKEALAGFWNSYDQTTSSADLFLEELNRCGQQLRRWGANKFGHLPRRISDLQSNISQLNYVLSKDDNLTRIRKMESELDHLLALDESYWKQRSRMDWLANGDINTKFFHHKASTRRKTIVSMGSFPIQMNDIQIKIREEYRVKSLCSNLLEHLDC